MPFPPDFYTYLQQNSLVEIRGGRDREKYLEIWMVVVGNRVFARSWNKSERSWFTEIIRTGVGRIKYGDNAIDIKGQKVAKEDQINEAVDQAYLTKYTTEANLYYAKGITQPEYHDYTMEFFYDQGGE